MAPMSQPAIPKPLTREAQVARASRALILASFMSTLGFNFVFPLLPLYMRELAGPGPEAAIWSGLAFAATPLVGAVAAPFWGRLSDRYGYRPMLLRALVSNAFIIALMGFPTEPWQLVALRAMAGGLGAFQAVAMGAMATWSRPEHLSRALSRLQMSQMGGAIVGPVAGGVIAALFGIRFSPMVGGVVITLGVILVARWLHEPGGRKARISGASQPLRVGLLWLPILTLLAVQFTDSSFNPILPLLLAQGSGSAEAAAGLSGLAASASAGAAALGAWLGGRIFKMGIRRGIMISALGALALISLVAVMAPVPWGVVVLRVACGGMVAGVAVAAYSAGGLMVQPGQRGAAYGWLSSASMAGFAASPIAAGLLSAVDLRAVLVVDSALCLLAMLVWTRSQPVILVDPLPRVENRRVSEKSAETGLTG